MTQRVYKLARWLWLTSMLISGMAGVGAADDDYFVFALQGGGQVEGHWLNPRERPLRSYAVRLTSGAQLRLDRQQVNQVRRRSLDAVRYDQIAPGYADTIDAQWELAEWCRQRRLLDQRKVHLERILELDPDHMKARRGLGYVQAGDQWLTRTELRESQGFVYFRGRWRMPQEARLLEQQLDRRRAELEWAAKLKQWHKDLDGKRRAEARQQISQIRDPHAVRAVSETLTQKVPRDLKLLHVRVLSEIGNRDAVTAMINASLNDPDPEVFHAVVDEIVELDSPYPTRAYIKGLNDSNNARVNRSAYVLGQIGDPVAIGPLVNALVTTHQTVYQATSNRSQALPINTTFANTELRDPRRCNTGPQVTDFSAGSQPVVVTNHIPNQEVLQALAKLTNGVSFGFDRQAWENWLAVQQQSESPVTLRQR